MNTSEDLKIIKSPRAEWIINISAEKEIIELRNTKSIQKKII